MGLGPNAGFWRSSQLVPQIIAAVDRLGNAFNTEQVVRMVSRGESYSRAGLHGLAQLYDKWPDHARGLNLPQAFLAAGVNTIAWYCAARERYPELSSFNLWAAFAARRLPVTRFGDVELAEDDGLSERLWSKWPNRGDSALLDNLVWLSDSGELHPSIPLPRATRCSLTNRNAITWRLRVDVRFLRISVVRCVFFVRQQFSKRPPAQASDRVLTPEDMMSRSKESGGFCCQAPPDPA